MTERFFLDKNADEKLTREELKMGLSAVYDFIEEHLDVFLDAEELDLIRKKEAFSQEDLEALIPEEGFLLAKLEHETIKLTWTKNFDNSAGELLLRVGFFKKFGREHQSLVRFMGTSNPIVAVVSADDPDVEFKLR